MTFATGVLFVRDAVHSKLSLALVGITTVALSIGASFGLSLYLQIPFTSLSQVCASACNPGKVWYVTFSSTSSLNRFYVGVVFTLEINDSGVSQCNASTNN